MWLAMDGELLSGVASTEAFFLENFISLASMCFPTYSFPIDNYNLEIASLGCLALDITICQHQSWPLRHAPIHVCETADIVHPTPR